MNSINLYWLQTHKVEMNLIFQFSCSSKKKIDYLGRSNILDGKHLPSLEMIQGSQQVLEQSGLEPLFLPGHQIKKD